MTIRRLLVIRSNITAGTWCLVSVFFGLLLVSCGGADSGTIPFAAPLSSSHTVEIQWNNSENGYENEFVAVIDGSHSTRLNVEYQWSVNGALIVDDNYNTIDTRVLPNWFARGDVIGLEVFFMAGRELVAAKDLVIPNQKPLLLSAIAFDPVSAGVLDTIGLSEIPAYDADDDELSITYQWFVDGVVLPDQTGSTLPPGVARYPHTVSVVVSVSDGIDAIAADPISMEISDTPAIFEFDTPSTALQYGQPFTATGRFVDPDGTAVATEMPGAPDGFVYDATTGVMSWSVEPLMFNRSETYHAHFRTDSGELSSISLTVDNPDHKSWLARSGIESPQAPNGLTIGDIDGDGTNEILGTDNKQRIFSLEFKDDTLQQDWLFPYPTADRMPIQSIYALNNQHIAVISEQSVSVITSPTEPPATVFQPDTKISASTFADLDRDGNAELVLHVENELLIITPATWTQVGAAISLPPTNANYSVITTGNVDNDLSLEIVTGAGHVIDGATKEIQWTLSSGFGLVVTGDLDGDGRSEIVGKKYSTLPTVYDAELQSERYSLNIDSVCGMSIDNVDSDPQQELLIGPCTGQFVYIYDVSTGLAVQQEEISSRPENANPLSRFSSTHNSPAIGDVDNDGIGELVFATEEHTFVAALDSKNDVSPASPFSNNYPATLGTYYLAGWSPITPERHAAVFVTPRTESRGAFTENGQGLAILEENGALTVNKAAYANWSNSTANALFDSNEDGVAEVLISVGDAYDGIVQHIRLDDFSVLHEHRDLGSTDEPEVLSIESVDNNSSQAVLAIENNRVQLYDVLANTALWTSPQMPGELIGAHPFFADETLKLLVRTYAETSVWARMDDFFVRQHTIADLCRTFVELDREGENLFACAGRQNIWSEEEFVIYDGELNELYRFTHEYEITALTATPEGSLLIAVTVDGDHYLQHSENRLVQITPTTGQVIWESAPILGQINGIEVFNDREKSRQRVVVATDLAMYLSP